MTKYKNWPRKGFTYIELLMAVGIFVILISMLIINLNPARQFAQARNTQRVSAINTIAIAVSQRTADHQQGFEENCSAGAIPTASAVKMTSDVGGYNIASCLVPAYLSLMPFDPQASGAHYASSTDYDTGYYIQKSTTTRRITITAPSAELGQSISVTQ